MITIKFAFSKALFIAAFLLAIFAFSSSPALAINLSACQDLSVENGTYVLVQNVSSPGTCFNITANNITLDGAGHTVNYSGSVVGYAINDTGGYDNVTIKNLNIVQGNNTLADAYAIYTLGMTNSAIVNNTITTSGGSGYGIYLYASSNSNTISNNTIATSGSGGSGFGIYLQSSSNSNTISNNTITTSGGNGYGIYFTGTSNSNTISNNTITTSGSNGYCIYIYSSSNATLRGNRMNSSQSNGLLIYSSSATEFNHSVDTSNLAEGLPILYYFNATNLEIRNQDYSNTYGQLAFGWSNNITIDNVRMSNDGFSLFNTDNSRIVNSNVMNTSKGYGLFLYSFSTNNTISTNTIATSGTYSHGIYLYASSNSNTISNNAIAISGTYSHGVYLALSTTNAILNNTITTSGSSGYGIYFLSSSNSNAILNNTITTSGSSGYGIHLFSSSNSNTLSNNTIATSGTYSHGIYLYSSSTNNITGGSITSLQSYDYYLVDAGTTNNFTNTNFTAGGLTAQRKIYFYDDTSWFNYNDQTSGNIHLKTSVSAQGFLNRTLSDWSGALVRWNDANSTAGMSATYNFTGLLANTTYRVYNSSRAGQTNSSNFTTTASGELAGFSIMLNGNTEIALSAVMRYNFTLQNSTSNTMTNATLTVYTDDSNVISGVGVNSSSPSAELDLEGNTKYHVKYSLQGGQVLDIKNLTIGIYTALSPQFVESFSGTLPASTTRRSYTIALNDSGLSYGYAEITLPVTGTVNRILHCMAWNFTLGSCSNWESNDTSDYNAFVNSTHMIFNVTRFDAYAGGYLEAAPTATPIPTSAPSGGSSGGGTIIAPTRNVTAFSDGLFPVKIAVSLNKEVPLPGLTVTAVSSISEIPAPQGVGVYRYLDITKANFNNSDIETATIEFEVDLSWISENGIAAVYLARYETGTWKKLRTESVNSTSLRNTYKAYADGFSYFAILGEKTEGAPTTPTPVPTFTSAAPTPVPTSTQAPAQQSPIGTPANPGSVVSQILVPMAFVIIVIAGLFVLISSYRQK